MSGATLEFCSADGTTYLEQECLSEEACLAGLTSGSCEGRAAPPTTTNVLERTLRICKSDGSGFDEETCDSPALCQVGLASGSCASAECMPQELFCVGTELRRCNEDRINYTPLGTCATEVLCNLAVSQSNAGCIQPQCDVGETQCEQNRLMVCNAERTDYELSDDCNTGERVCVEQLSDPATCETRDITPLVQLAGAREPTLSFGIDAHEVSQFQYYQFLITKLKADDTFDMSGQSSECTFNATYWSGDFPTEVHDAVKTRPTYPMTEWTGCDAKAYCEWAGKRLADATSTRSSFLTTTPITATPR